jgi:DNA adenine methylase
MQYLGGKSKLARKIVNAIQKDTPIREIWEPFCGGAAVTYELSRRGFRGVASDIHPALIHMYKALQSGWEPPLDITEEQYRDAKLLPDSDPNKAFFGFGCSFGGKWFGGYARSRGRHHGNESYRSILSMSSLWADAGWVFEILSFFDIPVFDMQAIIYCDPPYCGTQGYSTGFFDSGGFWSTCKRWAELIPVYVSEFDCPIPADMLLEITRTRAVNGERGRPVVKDRLFKIKGADARRSRRR